MVAKVEAEIMDKRTEKHGQCPDCDSLNCAKFDEPKDDGEILIQTFFCRRCATGFMEMYRYIETLSLGDD